LSGVPGAAAPGNRVPFTWPLALGKRVGVGVVKSRWGV